MLVMYSNRCKLFTKAAKGRASKKTPANYPHFVDKPLSTFIDIINIAIIEAHGVPWKFWIL